MLTNNVVSFEQPGPGYIILLVFKNWAHNSKLPLPLYQFLSAMYALEAMGDVTASLPQQVETSGLIFIN